MTVSDWDARWLDLAELVGSWSKDRSRKVGAVIVGADSRVLSLGWNGFPRGVNDEVDERHERPAKYLWTEHAERNAIYNAAAHGIGLAGAAIYLPWYPCTDCARAIAQSGITTVVCVEPDADDPQWAAQFLITRVIFREAQVEVRFVSDRVAPRAATESSIHLNEAGQPIVTMCARCRFCESTAPGDYRCSHHNAIVMSPGYHYECAEGQEW